MDNTVEKNYVKALSKGNKKAFETLFLQYQPKLVCFLKGFVKNDELARDMAQDIFLSLWKDRNDLCEVKSFQAYIFGMAKNIICNYYDHLIVNEKFLEKQKTKSTYVENLEDLIFADQLQSMINEAVSQMPPQRKQIYIMSRVDGLSNAKIAEKLNINKRTVENHLTLALSELRKVVKVFILFIC